jgi:ABC-type tungstate transport system permease subunit
MSVRNGVLVLLLVPIAALSGCGGDSGATGSKRGTLVLATTTSTQDSGLLDALIPAFERAEGYEVKTLAVGSGQAIELGRRGEADTVLVHSPDAERELMATGVAGRRLLVMHNDFGVAGPTTTKSLCMTSSRRPTRLASGAGRRSRPSRVSRMRARGSSPAATTPARTSSS